MFNSLNRQEVYLLLQDRSAAALLREEHARLDADLQRELQRRAAFENELAMFNQDLDALIPEPPEVYEYIREHTRAPVWWRRPLLLPVWSLSLAATLLIAVALAFFYRGEAAVSSSSAVPDLLQIQRAADLTGDVRLQKRNQQLFEALMDRASYWMDLQTSAGYRYALFDLEQALLLYPDNTRCLQYLVVVCEALGFSDRLEHYRALLDAS